MRTIAIITVCLLISGCNREEVILQPPVADVELTIRASPMAGSRGTPVTITAEVANRGITPRICSAGCDYLAPGMGFQLYDPNFNPVYLSDPRTRPKCLDYDLSFLPREKFTGVITFDGNLFGSNGDQLATQRGTYTAIVSFRSWRDRESPEVNVIENRITFRWSSQ